MKTMNQFLEDALKEEKNQLNEKYAMSELNKINVDAETVSIVVTDYDGNKTKYLGLNDKQSLMALKNFVEKRMKAVKQMYSYGG